MHGLFFCIFVRQDLPVSKVKNAFRTLVLCGSLRTYPNQINFIVVLKATGYLPEYILDVYGKVQ